MQISPDKLKQCWFLVGPTAVGKSELSLALAEKLNAEILSLDSMAIYRRMDVGTAKPSQADRQRVPHHLIDLIDPHEEYSLAEYVEQAEGICEALLNRDRVPLFVGGTGLYLRGLLRGIFDGPPADWEFRKEKEEQATNAEPGFLHQELSTIDPPTAAVLHPNDERRIIRALEVFRATGIPLSEQQQQKPLSAEVRPPHVYWLEPPREWLYQRINMRVDQMMQQGLLEETRQILDLPKPPGRTARQALGYRELIDHLEGRLELEEAIELIKSRTRQFAKRQHTWFRNLEECSSFPISGTETPDGLVKKFLAKIPDKTPDEK